MSKVNNKNTFTTLLNLWQHLHTLPAGRWLFSKIMNFSVPYTGSINAKVLELKPGYAKIQLRDRRRVRNHLNSIHALALANLGEYTSGISMLSSLSSDIRGIPTKISTDYYKKARGTLIAESTSKPPKVTEDIEFEVYTNIKDSEGDVVAKTTVNWRLGLINNDK